MNSTYSFIFSDLKSIRNKVTRLVLYFTICIALGLALPAVGVEITPYGTNDRVSAQEIEWQLEIPLATEVGEVGLIRSIAVDATGYVYVTGFRSGPPGVRGFLWKLDPKGTLIWEKQLDDMADNAGNAVAVGSGGHVYVAGFLFQGKDNDFLVQCHKPDGELVWRKTIDNGGDESGYGIAVGSNGQVTVTGRSWTEPQVWQQRCSEFNAGSGPTGILAEGGYWLVATWDSDGTLLWERSTPGFGRAVAVSKGGRIHAIGDEGGAIKTYSAEGELLWEKPGQISEKESGWGLSHAVDLDAAGNIFVSGILASAASNDQDTFLLKYDPSGTLLWRQQFDDVGNDPNYAMTGDGKDGVFLQVDSNILHCDASGQILWNKKLGWIIQAMTHDKDDSLYLGGRRGKLSVIKLRVK